MEMFSKRARIRQIWSETRWFLLGMIWLAGLTLGYAWLGMAQSLGYYNYRCSVE